MALLDNDELVGPSCGLGPGSIGASAELLANDGSLDERENAYRGLCVFIAAQNPEQAAELAQRRCNKALEAELERARSGRTGLGEYACRALATLGDKDH